jgi:hypothetical protein
MAAFYRSTPMGQTKDTPLEAGYLSETAGRPAGQFFWSSVFQITGSHLPEAENLAPT